MDTYPFKWYAVTSVLKYNIFQWIPSLSKYSTLSFCYGMNMQFFPDSTQAFIFDVDGTLYNQGKLRRRIILELLHNLVRTQRFIRDIYVLYTFRRKREILSRNTHNIGDLENRQYADVAHELGMGIEDVRHIVKDWIFEKPLKHVAQCAYPGVKDLFFVLKQKGYKIGIFSDYPCHAKLKALGLFADVMVCATEKEIDRFKPDPKGLLYTAEKLGMSAMNCFFIGDRDDNDGECARRAGMPYHILSRCHVSTSDWYRKVIRLINYRENESYRFEIKPSSDETFSRKAK
jgi:putative hydrolase of the HAD superfamily